MDQAYARSFMGAGSDFGEALPSTMVQDSLAFLRSAREEVRASIASRSRSACAMPSPSAEALTPASASGSLGLSPELRTSRPWRPALTRLLAASLHLWSRPRWSLRKSSPPRRPALPRSAAKLRIS